MVQPGSQANPKRIAVVVDRGMDKGLQTRNIQHTLKSREPIVDGGWPECNGFVFQCLRFIPHIHTAMEL